LHDALQDWPLQARDLDGELVCLSWHHFGGLMVPSGALLACDPFILDHTSLSTLPPITIPPGHYPVLAATAQLTVWGEGIVVAVLRVHGGKVVAWQTKEEAPRFVVDSGVASFIDRDVAQFLAAQLAADRRYSDDLFRLMMQRSPGWVNVTLAPATGANLIAMCTAKGDDLYPCRAGYTASGDLACLTMDFRAIDLATLADAE
jgi:hypothetical protein